jgi:hypothetical protein
MTPRDRHDIHKNGAWQEGIDQPGRQGEQHA